MYLHYFNSLIRLVHRTTLTRTSDFIDWYVRLHQLVHQTTQTGTQIIQTGKLVHQSTQIVWPCLHSLVQQQDGVVLSHLIKGIYKHSLCETGTPDYIAWYTRLHRPVHQITWTGASDFIEWYIRLHGLVHQITWTGALDNTDWYIRLHRLVLRTTKTNTYCGIHQLLELHSVGSDTSSVVTQSET
jgi:hypothetical protein